MERGCAPLAVQHETRAPPPPKNLQNEAKKSFRINKRVLKKAKNEAK